MPVSQAFYFYFQELGMGSLLSRGLTMLSFLAFGKIPSKNRMVDIHSLCLDDGGGGNFTLFRFCRAPLEAWYIYVEVPVLSRF